MTMTVPATPRQRYYNATGDRYESDRYGDPHMEGYRAFRNETLLGILNEAFGDQPLRILEIGCGTGPSLEFLAGASRRYSLFGMDASDTMLRQAARKGSALSNRPKLALGDATRLPFGSGFFDVVFATRFIHQFSHDVKRHLWQEFHEVVRPGGLVVLEFYGRPYHWVRYYLGGRKGRSRQAYFDHYPSRSEVRDVIEQPLDIRPLRLVGSRVVAGLFGDGVVRRATRAGGHAFGGMLVDEYFVVARKR